MAEVIERDATVAPVKRDTPPAPKPHRLLDQVRDRIRVLHYSRSTEATYTYWIKFYIHFHGLRHPKDMGAAGSHQRGFRRPARDQPRQHLAAAAHPSLEFNHRRRHVACVQLGAQRRCTQPAQPEIEGKVGNCCMGAAGHERAQHQRPLCESQRIGLQSRVGLLLRPYGAGANAWTGRAPAYCPHAGRTQVSPQPASLELTDQPVEFKHYFPRLPKLRSAK